MLDHQGKSVSKGVPLENFFTMKNTTSRFVSLLVIVLLAVIWIAPSALKAAPGSIYNANTNPLLQLSGSPGASANIVTETATMSLQPFQPQGGTSGTGNGDFNILTEVSGANSISSTSTINAGAVSPFGTIWIVTLLSNSASDSSGVTYTFGTNFKPTGTVAVSAGKSLSVLWISDGTYWREVCRSASAQ